ncbi:unnamed protein product [Boreogadus saida]
MFSSAVADLLLALQPITNGVGGSTTNRIRSARLPLHDACLRSKTKDKMFAVQTLIVATLLTQLVFAVAPSSKALQPASSIATGQASIADQFLFSGFPTQHGQADSHITPKDNPQLYAAKVIHAMMMRRPLDFPILRHINVGPICHSGLVVTLADKTKWLIHKGNGFKGVTLEDAKITETEKWTGGEEKDSKKGKTVEQLVETAGEDYHLGVDNCHTATKKMYDIVKRAMKRK